jgi:NitT/TauT family transport system substrate-binding protein
MSYIAFFTLTRVKAMFPYLLQLDSHEMMKLIKPRFMRRFLLLLVLMLSGCGPSKEIVPPDQINIQLKWVHQAQFAGYYLAREAGYYAEEGIEPTFIEGGPNIDLVQQVVDGMAAFGIDAPEQILQAVSQGIPIKAIAVIYRLSPMIFISMANSEIETPRDMLGHSIAILGSDAEPQLHAMMDFLGLDVTQVEMLPYQYDLASFYSGEADMTIGYTTGTLLRILQAGYEVNLIEPNDYGVHLYADTLFTTEQMINEHPDLVTRFARATLRGWQEAIEDPPSAVEDTLKYALEADRELQTRMFEASIPLVFTGEDNIGWMNTGHWLTMYQMLLDQGLLDQPFDVAQAIDMQFLKEIYHGN